MKKGVVAAIYLINFISRNLLLYILEFIFRYILTRLQFVVRIREINLFVNQLYYFFLFSF